LAPGAYAEPTTNTLVVLAPPETLPFIDSLIEQLESKTPKEGRAQTYELKNVRAEQIWQNVDAMLKAKIAEKEGVKKGSIQTAVFSDPAANRLFVFAPDEYQELAGKLINMIDAEVSTGELIHIVPLTDGDATQLAASLSQVLQGGARGGAQARVRITADAGSNSILLGGTVPLSGVATSPAWSPPQSPVMSDGGPIRVSPQASTFISMALSLTSKTQKWRVLSWPAHSRPSGRLPPCAGPKGWPPSVVAHLPEVLKPMQPVTICVTPLSGVGSQRS
jgi:hypothetical protein